MSVIQALTGADIFDGETTIAGAALLVQEETCLGAVPLEEVPGNAEQVALNGGLLAPGFVDLQVNGGGGIQFNAKTDAAGIRTICKAHARFGTTALLPTLITDTTEVTDTAIKAAAGAAARAVPGFLGLHLEGPHLSVEKKGAHDPALIRPMTQTDLDRLIEARQHLPHLMVTVAPEAVTNQQIAALANSDIRVSLGHSAATYATAKSGAGAGAVAVTHLFNAMSPLNHREPGLVGAALDIGSLSAGIIADGIHVDRTMIAIALRSKNGPGSMFLVTDAMATLGTDLKSLTLNGRKIQRARGRLTLEDGTLAGADLDMISAVRFMVDSIGVDLEEALRMASLYPARVIGAGKRLGHLKEGATANIVHLDEGNRVRQVWINGNSVFTGQ